ncbi:MAG: HIT domain-containing protein [Alphaproteobacteria bacterium]
MEFLLDRRLAADSLAVTELPLCEVRLMNNKLFPWLILIPKRPDVSEWIELAREDQHQLSDEIAILSHLMTALVTPDKLNIAALGNQVRQLHVHLIARYKSDSAWPNPVWGGACEAYKEEESRRFIYDLKTAIDSLQFS